MTPDQDILAELPPLAPAELLDLLLAVRRRAKTDPQVEVPLATFHLQHGRDVTGWVLAWKSSHQDGRVLTVQLADAGGAPGRGVTYLCAARIEAVTIHDARAAAHFLSDGVLPAPEIAGDRPPPTRLELKRMARKLAERLQARAAGLELQVDWESVPESGQALRALERLLQDSVEALVSIAADQLGKDELAKLEQVRLVDGQQAAVGLEGGALVIAARLEAGPAGRLAPERLRADIEKAL